MPKLLFAWLGSGRTKRSHVGALGRYLDQAARAGLPVPPGAVLLDELYRLALSNDLVTTINQRVVCADPDSLHATIFESLRLPRFDRPVVIRAIIPDSADRSAGVADHDEPVNTSDAGQFGSALAAAWTELAQLGAEQRDVLLLETVAATHTGTAVSLLNDVCDQVSYTAIPATMGAEPNAGSVNPPSINKLSGWRLPDDSLPPHLQRLQMLLRGVRRTMAPGNWVISWADDGAICRLLELRLLAANDTYALPS